MSNAKKKNNKESEKFTLKGYYYSLPIKGAMVFRIRLMARCGIKSRKTFYNWMNNPQSINPLMRTMINRTAKQILNYD